MANMPLRIGIIGADIRASWAGASHIPAIQAQPGLKLAAVATRKEESAKAAADAFGAERCYANPYDLICDDSIDIVTVAVKVPAHRDLVLAALEGWQSRIAKPRWARRWWRLKKWPLPRGCCIPQSDCRGG